MTKNEALNMSYDEWQAILDPDHWEYLDHMKDIVGFSVSDKEACWVTFQEELKFQERDLGNYFNRVSKEDAWELYENNSKEDIQNKLEEDLYAQHVAQEMEWHHIEPVNDPYWKQCVDLIEEKLK